MEWGKWGVRVMSGGGGVGVSIQYSVVLYVEIIPGGRVKRNLLRGTLSGLWWCSWGGEGDDNKVVYMWVILCVT